MWLDCRTIDKLVNLDTVRAFEVVKNDEREDHEYRLEMLYANVFEIRSDVGDPMGGSEADKEIIFEGTYGECREEYNQIFSQIAVREKEIIATMQMVAKTFGMATKRPAEAKGFRPEMEVSEPDIANTPLPEGAMDAMAEMVDEQKAEPVDVKRVLLYVMPNNYPATEGSEDKRGVRGGLGIIKEVIRTVARIRDNDIDTIPLWYKDVEGDIEYTITKNMARDTELKQMADNEGFVNLIQ